MSKERGPAFNPDAGEHVESAARRLQAMARERNEEVFCLFNDTPMVARPGMLLEEVLAGWSEGRRRTNETTPDAVELLHEWAAIADSESIGRLEMVRVALLAERARHAEERAALRDQLRRVEGERDRAKQGELDAINAMAKARQKQQDAEAAADLDRWLGHDIGEESQGQFQRLYLRRKALEREQSNLRRYIQVERGGSVVNTVRLMATELTSLRSLLPDVRACAEFCVSPYRGSGQAPPPGARRILTALDSAECPECHLDGGHKMSCSRGGSKGGRFGVSLDSRKDGGQ